MKSGFELHTRAYDNGQIHQDLYAFNHGHMQRIQSSLVDTSEAQIRQALVLLGWTPPAAPGAADIPTDVAAHVQLVPDAPPQKEAPAQARPGPRLAHEVMITSRESAAHALNHVAEACKEDLRHQGMALQDFALPALRWALLRIGVLEGELRVKYAERRRHFSDSRPAALV